MQTRRDFLRNTALLSGAAGLWGTLGESVQRAMAIEPDANTGFEDAEHVVILMQENRSFDHCFGSLRGVRGFNDPRAITLPSGNPVWVQTDSAGKSFAPFRLNIKDTRATWMGNLPHHWESQVEARNNGRHDRWLDAKRSGHKDYADMPLTMGHYTREDIPFYYELADAFTICDQHFCSSLTGTTPNRLHLWTGTIRAEQSIDSQANVSNEDADNDHEIQWTTFPERLEAHGVSWKVFQNELYIDTGFTEEEEGWLSNFGDNPLEYFKQFRVRYSKAYRDNLERLSQTLPAKIAEIHQRLASPELSAAAKTKTEKTLKTLIASLARVQAERPLWTQENYEKLSARDKNLHEKAFSTNAADPTYRQLDLFNYADGTVQRQLQLPKGDVLHEFRKDVEAGSLPAVSWIVAPEKFSDHPCSAWYGAWYISEVLNILTQNPKIWKKTIFILTYDENDGYFDHVPPFVAPNPNQRASGFASSGIDTGLEYVQLEQDRKRVPRGAPRESPIGLGYRVPMIVASPWSRGGCVCSQVFDHTSVLQFLEKFAGRKTGKPLVETNISSWRRTISGDLTSIFQSTPKQDAPLQFARRDAVVQGIHKAQFQPLPAGYRVLTAEQLTEIRQGGMTSQVMPRQEPGTRPSSPLPYELYADGAVNKDKTAFTLQMAAGKECFGDRSAGCPFTVYALTDEGKMQIRNYAVSAGDQIEDHWNLSEFTNGIYHLKMNGPNGFYREFIGSGENSPVAIQLKYGRRASGTFDGTLQFTLTNHDDRRTVGVLIRDMAYKTKDVEKSIAPGEAVVLLVNTERSFHWYDLALTLKEVDGFQYRFAGRVETGEWGVSDPGMA